eukprot:GGOE01001529.1.p1 GENE.GGOE01001529.1~~GGOE01001529.1.p1  ORF type:complete len:621 (-),score=183.00 GGOE01001529.1:278-2077(-)
MSEPDPKRRKKLDADRVHLDALPNGAMYERSYMHTDCLAMVLVTPKTDFVVTLSIDGHLKFWKKLPIDIIFVKHFRPHLGMVSGMAMSKWDGQLICTASEDRSVKVFDVVNFDMINMIKLGFTPGAVELICPSVHPKARLVVCHRTNPTMTIFDPHDGGGTPLQDVNLHSAPVRVIQFNHVHHTVVSASQDGMLEYWSSDSYQFEAKGLRFTSKLDTDLYDFGKDNTVPYSLDFSRDGQLFAMWGKDRQLRVYRFLTGKRYRAYNESVTIYTELQKDKEGPYALEPIDFGRRLAMEKELEAAMASGTCCPYNAVFDDSGHFLIYATLLGIKVVHLPTNTLNRLLGKVEGTERFMQVALFQGIVKQSQAVFQLAQKDLAREVDFDQPDPSLFCVAYKRVRFYIFTRREPEEADEGDSTKGRDVFNEKLSKEEIALAVTSNLTLGQSAIIRTTMGDIHVKLFPDESPKAVENFSTHSRAGYYNGHLFHRIIKGFMLQTGDPGGDGRGGESIWGGDFEDEFSKGLKFDRPFILAMANAGPNTNGSQFFITTVPTPHLDSKHTIFGRVTKGMDVVQAIEKVKTDRFDKPLKDVKMINIEILAA